MAESSRRGGDGSSPVAFEETLSAAAAPAPVAPAAPGAVIADRYEIVRMIAAGGMGEVYEAFDRELGEKIALKRIRGAGVGNPTTVERFKREIQLARKVTHANVCRIHDLGIHKIAGSDEQEVFLSMELLPGETLAERIKRAGKLSLEEARPIVEQLAAALGAAHAAGIIHRDFKCQNVILVGDRVVVTDFGLARLGADHPDAASITGTGAGMIGTPAYMAPEQVVGGEVTAAADIYALGVVMYEMVTGKLPFVGDSALSTAAKRLRDDPEPPSVDPRWDAVILRCLARSPNKRFASAADVVAALAPDRRRWRGAAIGGAGLAVAGAVAAMVLARGGGSHPHVSGTRTVAVIGFRNTTGSAEAAWISTGLAQMLGTELSTGDLHAVASEAVARARTDLGLPDADSFAPDTLGRIRANTGADYVLVGSYVESGGKLRLDLRLQDTASGSTIASVSETTTDAALVDAVPGLAAKLRDGLGMRAAAVASTGVSRDPEAAKLYAQGLDRDHAFDPAGARELLAKAVERDPQAPLSHYALSRVLAGLGYDRDMMRQAIDEAHSAQLLAKDLPEDQRLAIEANYHELAGELDAAIAGYRTLATRHPDDVDNGIALIRTLHAAKKDDDATKEIARLRARPERAEDPQLDEIEANLAAERGDRGEQLAVLTRGIAHARARGARGLMVDMLVERAWISAQTGQEPEAGTAAAREAEQIARELGDQLRIAEALHVEVTNVTQFSDFPAALPKFDEIIRIEAAGGNRRRAIDTLADRIFFELTMGKIDDGERDVLRMKDLVAAAGFGEARAEALELWALLERGEVTKAADALARLDELVKQFPQEAQARNPIRVAILDADAGRVAVARKALEAAQADAIAHHDVVAGWYSLIQLISIAYDEGRAADALSLSRQLAGTIPPATGDFYTSGQIVLLRALAANHQLDEARRVFAEISPHWASVDANISLATYGAAVRLEYDRATGDAKAAEADADALAKQLPASRAAGAIRYSDDAELVLASWELSAGRAADARTRLAALEKDARARGAVRVAERAKHLR